MDLHGKVTAKRLTLVSQIDGWLFTPEPVFVATGETYWFDLDTTTLCVESIDGAVRRYVCAPKSGPDAPR